MATYTTNVKKEDVDLVEDNMGDKKNFSPKVKHRISLSGCKNRLYLIIRVPVFAVCDNQRGILFIDLCIYAALQHSMNSAFNVCPPI